MAAPRLIVIETVAGLGKPGLAGALLLLASLAWSLAAILPAGQELARVKEKAAQAELLLARVDSGQAAMPKAPEAERDAFYGALPAQAAATEWIERIYGAAAAEQISLDRGEYAQAEVADTRLARYRLVLPVRGEYARIRRFIAAAQAAVPNLGLDDINLRRQAIGDAQVDASVQFSLYLARP